MCVVAVRADALPCGVASANMKREVYLLSLCVCMCVPVCICVACFVCLCKEGRKATFQEVIEGLSNGRRQSWKCEEGVGRKVGSN